jgi:hypothetical protein
MSAPTQIEEWVKPLSRLANGESMAALVLVPSHFTPALTDEQSLLPERVEAITIISDGLACRLHIYYPSRQGLDTAILSALIPSRETATKDIRPEPPATPPISEVARQISGLSGWLRSVNPLPWSGPSPISFKHKAVRGWMNPEPADSEEEPLEDEGSDESVFMAHGEFLE